MHTSVFFKLFPPPKFLEMRHAGLDISDDAIRCLEYGHSAHGLCVNKSGSAPIPTGLFEAGDVKDEKALINELVKFNKEHHLSYVKVSVPEEKAYLFETEVPETDPRAIEQNIEFKLEENVPLAAADAVFYFDVLPATASGGSSRTSVSVVPRTYIEKYSSILEAAGMIPVAFEVVSKSIALAVVPKNTGHTNIIVHLMPHKTGIYVVSDGIICFTSTVSIGSACSSDAEAGECAESLSKEISRVNTYWASRLSGGSSVDGVLLVGSPAEQVRVLLETVPVKAPLPIRVGNIWQNVFDLNAYLPSISKADSLDYAVAAGLALSL